MLPYFKISSELIYTYPLMMGLAWGFSFNLFKSLTEKYTPSFQKPNIFFWSVFIISWIGAKLFFILTTTGISPDQYALSANFWLGGGFVFYGGLIFGALYTLVFLKLTNQSFKSLAVVIPPLALGHSIGRVGCFLAGCCFGKPWGFAQIERYPVQLFESFGLIFIGVYSIMLLKRNKSPFVFYVMSYSLLRFLLEFLRGDSIRGLWSWGLSTSQTISLILIGISILGLLKLRLKQRVINKA